MFGRKLLLCLIVSGLTLFSPSLAADIVPDEGGFIEPTPESVTETLQEAGDADEDVDPGDADIDAARPQPPVAPENGRLETEAPGLRGEALPPVTLDLDDPAGDLQLGDPGEETPFLLKGVLVKTRTLPVDIPTVIRVVKMQNLLIGQSLVTRKIQSNLFYRSLTDLVPDLSASYSASTLEGGRQFFGDEVIPIQITQIEPRLQATIFYNPVRELAESWAAYRRSGSAKYLLQETAQEQLSLAVQEYYLLVEAAFQRRNALQGIEEARQQLELNEARRRVGVGTKLEVMQARAQLAQRELDLLQAENDLAVAEQQLLSRLNLDPSVNLLPTVEDLDKETLVADAAIDELIRLAVEHHPSVRQEDLEVKALWADFVTRFSDIIPTITLDTYVSWVGPDHDSLVRTESRGLRLEATILENGGLAYPLDLRRAFLEVRRQKLIRDNAIRQVETDISTAYFNSQALEKGIAVARQDLEANREAYRLSLGRYRAGLNIFLDVLTAQTALSTARTQLAQTVLGYNRAQVQLLESLGLVTSENLVQGLANVIKPEEELYEDALYETTKTIEIDSELD